MLTSGMIKPDYHKQMAGNSGSKRYVVDEEAFYNHQDKKEKKEKLEKEGQEMAEKSGKEGGDKKSYDKLGEPNLMKKLGLEKETDEDIIGKASDKDKKKSKEEQEREDGINEVKKIISEAHHDLPDLGNFMKEVDLLDLDFNASSSPTLPKSAEFDLYAFDKLPVHAPAQPQTQKYDFDLTAPANPSQAQAATGINLMNYKK